MKHTKKLFAIALTLIMALALSAPAFAAEITITNAGSVLPSTGGIGTTIFYVVGGLLMVGAGILLVTKKRMDDEE